MKRCSTTRPLLVSTSAENGMWTLHQTPRLRAVRRRPSTVGHSRWDCQGVQQKRAAWCDVASAWLQLPPPPQLKALVRVHSSAWSHHASLAKVFGFPNMWQPMSAATVIVNHACMRVGVIESLW